MRVSRPAITISSKLGKKLDELRGALRSGISFEAASDVDGTQEQVPSPSNTRPLEHSSSCWQVHEQAASCQDLPASRQACLAGRSRHWQAQSSGRNACPAGQSRAVSWQAQAHSACSSTSRLAHSLAQSPDWMPQRARMMGTRVRVVRMGWQLWPYWWQPPSHRRTDTWVGVT